MRVAAQSKEADHTFAAGITSQQPGIKPIVSGNPSNIPSGLVPDGCKIYWGTDQILDCYLNAPANSQIAASIIWGFIETVDLWNYRTWPLWTATEKQDLRTAFHNVVAWYKGGMQNYPGVLAPEPPPDVTEAASKLEA